MVFRSGSGSGSGYEGVNSNINNAPGVEARAMIASGSASSAAIVAKSPQLLHNFSLPNNLKWTVNHSPSSSRFRKLSLADSPSPLRENPSDPAVLRHGTQYTPPANKDVPAPSDQPRPQVDGVEEENSSGKRWTKIFLRLSNKNKGGGEAGAGDAGVAVEDQSQTVVVVAAAESEAEAEAEAEEDVPKTWNFRPRKPLVKKQPTPAATSTADPPKGGRGGGGGSDVREGQSQSPALVPAPAQPQAKVTTGNGKKKENKRKLSVSLSREEIEEDIYAMTGFKPSRRPKKRAKNVQKQLDSLYPGLWLSCVTMDAYKVPDPPLKN